MLLVQQHLINKTETLESLKERFGIFHKFNEDKSLVILDYDQIESSKQKDHRIVRECRGLVLENHTWKIVAKSFNRFFNYKENNDTEIFDWSNFSVSEKIDGSLIRISVRNNELMCFTRFSFSKQPISDLMKKSWEEYVFDCLTNNQKKFMLSNPKYTYVFEFCSPYTQVVKFYPEPQLFMLGLFNNQTGEEVSENNEIYKQCKIIFNWPKKYNFKSINEILKELDDMFKKDFSDEGFVIKDKNNIRLKLKNKKYLMLHRLVNNNIKSIKSFIPIVLSGEIDEFGVYFPNMVPYFEIIQNELKKDINELKEIYSKVIVKENIKDVAIYLTKEIYTPWSNIFFKLYKIFGNKFTFTQVEEEFMKSEELIIKVYKTRNILN